MIKRIIAYENGRVKYGGCEPMIRSRVLATTTTTTIPADKRCRTMKVNDLLQLWPM